MMLKAFAIFPCRRVMSCLIGLCVLASLAHAQTPPEGAGKPGAAPVFGRDVSALPPEVQRMREEILRAATSGEIEQLRVPVEMNELPPVFAGMAGKDPIAHFKSLSGDGHGREILAVLFELLTTGYAITDPGTEKEMVIWPYHAVLPLDSLSPGQEVELYRLISPERLKEMRNLGRYTWYRVGVGRDGVWHFFDKPE